MLLYARLFLVLVCALMLTIVPLPELWAAFRPLWTVLWLLMMQFYFPKYIRLWHTFLIGILLDVLLTTTTGVHSFALIASLWLTTSKMRRFRLYTIAQQMSLIALFCCIYQVVLDVIETFLNYPVTILGMICPPLISALLWPWVVILVDWLQKSARTSCYRG